MVWRFSCLSPCTLLFCRKNMYHFARLVFMLEDDYSNSPRIQMNTECTPSNTWMVHPLFGQALRASRSQWQARAPFDCASCRCKLPTSTEQFPVFVAGRWHVVALIGTDPTPFSWQQRGMQAVWFSWTHETCSNCICLPSQSR